VGCCEGPRSFTNQFSINFAWARGSSLAWRQIGLISLVQYLETAPLLARGTLGRSGSSGQRNQALNRASATGYFPASRWVRQTGKVSLASFFGQGRAGQMFTGPCCSLTAAEALSTRLSPADPSWETAPLTAATPSAACAEAVGSSFAQPGLGPGLAATDTGLASCAPGSAVPLKFLIGMAQSVAVFRSMKKSSRCAASHRMAGSFKLSN
jgi:hypothetical protein